MPLSHPLFFFSAPLCSSQVQTLLCSEALVACTTELVPPCATLLGWETACLLLCKKLDLCRNPIQSLTPPIHQSMPHCHGIDQSSGCCSLVHDITCAKMNLENMVESGDAIAMDLFLKAMQYRCFLETRFCDYLDLTIVDDVDRYLDFF